MPANININARDQQIQWVPPASNTDQRVPSAEELRENSALAAKNLAQSHAIERPAGLLNRPAFSVTGLNLTIPSGLKFHAPGHPAVRELAASATITLPSLADTVSTVSRYDRVYLAVMGVEFDATHDSALNISFQWTQGQNTQVLSKENTRRVRSVWALVWAPAQITANDLWGALPTDKKITVTNLPAGNALGTYRIYPLDAALANGAVHVVQANSIQMIELARVWRAQNFNQAGYIWGRNGEAGLTTKYHVQDSYRYVGLGWEDTNARAQQTLRRILAGESLPESPGRDLATYNLINGQNNANANSPGIATASPNGSTAIANDQRVSITNQAIVQQTYCLAVTTANAGGFAQASVPFQVNSPTGSIFSQLESDHKVYNASGVDVTLLGRLTGLGGNGALVWTASTAQAVTPGDVVYVVPGIYYPAGSGFPNSGAIDAVFVDAGAVQQIATANVRESWDDIDTYTAPANSENYIVVVGRERGAVHYVYARYTVTADATGVARIPANTNGVIAFISGANAPTGRIDRPIVAGLTANGTYNILAYRPFRSTEKWQFRWDVPRYAGSGEQSFLNGAIVASEPIFIGHTQGGGNSEFLAEGGLQHEVIAFRLPANTNAAAVPAHQANYKMQYQGEADLGYTSIRILPPQGATGLTMPAPGLSLSAPNAAGAQSRGIATKLQDMLGRPVGVRKVPIVCSQIYQLVSAFLVEKSGEYRLCVITQNGGDPSRSSGVAYDSDGPHYAAIDTFRLF